MSKLNYWYNGQIRAVLMQFGRIFGNFQIKTGKDANGVETYIRVPIRPSDMQRQVGHILRDNSENVMQSCPFMTFHMTGISMRPQDRQNPNHVGKLQVSERRFDEGTGQYTDQVGDMYTVERFMPVPYELTMELNIWTDSTDHKLQLLEQIMVLFNPSIDIQTSTNGLDWSALTIVEMQDSITWSDRSIPQGTDESLDIARLTFRVPVWINPPAKVQRQKIINQIVLNIEESKTLDRDDGDFRNWRGEKLDATAIITPGNHRIKIEYPYVTLLGENGKESDTNGHKFSWKHLFNNYGDIKEGASQLHIKTTADLDDHDTNIIGTFHYTDDENIILWSMDEETLPKGSLDPINGIIDPTVTNPQNGLPTPTDGTRYLITTEIDGPSTWGDINANGNDIIEYNNGVWSVAFTSLDDSEQRFVLNKMKNKLLCWHGSAWAEVVDGEYFPGFWRIIV